MYIDNIIIRNALSKLVYAETQDYRASIQGASMFERKCK